MEENKHIIADCIYTLLRRTRFGKQLKDVQYIPDYDLDNRLQNEWLVFEWWNGYTEKINVTADSGLSMIIDLAEWLKTK